MDGTEQPQTAPLAASISTDVCVVGAGIAGLSTDYLLSREGVKVIVIDDGPLCGGETGRTTAHLANKIDDSYQEIESLHGRDGARLAAESHTAAIDLIEPIVQEENIDCDFVLLDVRHNGQYPCFYSHCRILLRQVARFQVAMS